MTTELSCLFFQYASGKKERQPVGYGSGLRFITDNR